PHRRFVFSFWKVEGHKNRFRSISVSVFRLTMLVAFESGEREMNRARIFLADDHTLLVDAVRRLLEPEFEIVGTAYNGRELLAAVPKLLPDIVIVDLG